jgi:ABC-type transport system substrate-binding protein
LMDFCLTEQGMYARWFGDGKGYFNQEARDLYDKMAVNLDYESRRQQVIRIQEIVLDEVPHIYVCQGMWFHGVRNHMKDMYASYTQFYPGLRTAWLDK